MGSSKAYLKTPVTTAFPKDSVFFGIIDHYFAIMKETGVYDNMLVKYLSHGRGGDKKVIGGKKKLF